MTVPLNGKNHRSHASNLSFITPPPDPPSCWISSINLNGEKRGSYILQKSTSKYSKPLHVLIFPRYLRREGSIQGLVLFPEGFLFSYRLSEEEEFNASPTVGQINSIIYPWETFLKGHSIFLHFSFSTAKDLRTYSNGVSIHRERGRVRMSA